MSSAKEKILSLSADYKQRLKKLLATGPMLRGSFGQVFTRCGKSNCWCAHRRKGHPHTRLTWSQEGRMVTRKVPSQAAQDVQQLTRQYRQFRSERRALLALHSKMERLLDGYEKERTQAARRAFPFLRLKPKNAASFRKNPA